MADGILDGRTGMQILGHIAKLGEHEGSSGRVASSFAYTRTHAPKSHGGVSAMRETYIREREYIAGGHVRRLAGHRDKLPYWAH